MTGLTAERFGDVETAGAELPKRKPRRGQPRQRNPRRVTLEKLKAAAVILDGMVRRWQYVPGTDIYRNADGNLGHWGHRDRADIPASEYIENRPEFWVELHNQMAQLEEQARAIRHFAAEQYYAKGGEAPNA
jgi:hypothetical protein